MISKTERDPVQGHEYDADAYEQLGLTLLRVSLAHARGHATRLAKAGSSIGAAMVGELSMWIATIDEARAPKSDTCHECGEPNHGCPNGLCPGCEADAHDEAYAAELAEDEEGGK